MTICTENLLGGAHLMAVSGHPAGQEPTHGCRDCDTPLWAFDSGAYAVCPHCGEEAEALRYCDGCDRPNCTNPGC